MLEMFNKRKKPIDVAVDEQIARKFPEPPVYDAYYRTHQAEWEEEVRSYELDLNNYKDRTEQLSMLNDIQGGKRDKLNPNTVLSALVWSVGLLTVLNFEKFEVIRGKAFNMLPKLKI